MKLQLLDMGGFETDNGWLVQGSNASTVSEPNPVNVRKQLTMIGALIEHPKVGPILFDCGAAPDIPDGWDSQAFREYFMVNRYTDENRMPNALAAAGFGVEDIRAIIIPHMHLDHAGGLEFFRGRDVPVYVHELELKQAFYAMAADEDFGPYIPHYVDPSFNWQPIHESQIELFKGITLHHAPGHTPGTMAMQLDLPNSGTFLFPSDLLVFKENYEQSQPQGWLTRDRSAWWRSLRLIRTIAERTEARMVFSHDGDVLAELKKLQPYFD